MFTFFNLLYEIILFQNCLLSFFPIIGYVDELITFLLWLFSFNYIFVRFRKKVLIKSEKILIIFALIFFTIGLLSTIINRIQQENIAIVKDIIAISKFIICYLMTLILSRNINKDYLLKKIARRTKIYSNVIFICAIINIFVDIGMASDIRYGIRSFSFLFTHPTYLVASIIIMISVITANGDQKLTSKISLVQLICILILTFRNKAFMFIISYFAIRILIRYFKNIKVKYILPMILISLVASYDKVAQYLSFGLTAARPALYIVGVDLAKRYFPFGSGFGTFASSISGEYYSPIYYEYGINNVSGLTIDKYNYMSDTFWPYIYGQFGFIGMVTFISIIIFIIRSTIIRYRYDKSKLLSSLLIIIYILIASTAEAIFTDVTGTFFFIILATYFGNNTLENQPK